MRKGTGDSSLDDAVNMDVMMDNMTDVVGTLLMVLIIVQLQVNSAIDNIQSNLPQVTAEEARQAEQEAQDMQKKLERTRQEVAAATPASEELIRQVDEKRADLRRFEVTGKQDDATLMAVDKLQREFEVKKKALEVEKTAVAALLDERARLKALLDDTPIPQAEPAKIVRIPQAIEIPKGAVYVDVLCARGGVYGCDYDELEGLVMRSFAPARAKLLREMAKDSKGQEVAIFDHEKTTDFLNRKELDTKYFTLKFPVLKTRDVLRMEAHPKEGAGLDPSQRGSSFTKMLADVKRTGNAVVWFRVMPDSFDTYLAAREMCDRIGVPAGWEITTSPLFAKDMPEIKLNRLEEPPPPPPPVPPQPGDIVIPPLKRRID